LPQVRSRPVGEHARAAGFTWTQRAEQHRYRRELGLPEIHAAIINEDWETALELVCAEDLGLQWLPPSSHRSAPSWTTQLFSKSATNLQSTIVDIAIDKVSATSVGTEVVAYGANLITLTLLIPCPKAFRDKVFQLAASENSPYLHLPDGSGRTPLWIAIDRNDIDAVKFLLEAGASPNYVCPFASEGKNGLPLAWAATKSNNEVFALCLEKVLETYEISPWYSLELDPLRLQLWTKNKDEVEVLWLANKFPQLRRILLSLPDASGTSHLHKSLLGTSQAGTSEIYILAGQSYKKSFFFNPLVGTDPQLGPSTIPLMIAAYSARTKDFMALSSQARIIQATMPSTESSKTQMAVMFNKSIYAFTRYRSAQDLTEFILYIAKVNWHPTILKSIFDRLQNAEFDQYRSIVKALWPILKDEHKLEIFANSATRNDGRTEFVLDKMDCSLDEITLQMMIDIAAEHGNLTAFEYACERSVKIGEILGGMPKNPHWYDEQAWKLARQAITVRSTEWFSHLVKANLDVDPIIADHSEICLPMLADIDPDNLPFRLDSFAYFWGDDSHATTPWVDDDLDSSKKMPPNMNGLSRRLASLGIHITDQMIARATTEDGKQALRKLQLTGSSAQ
jgi:hypothetical protein